MSIGINATETRKYFIGWQDEASGGLEIDHITIRPVRDCNMCGETITVDNPDDYCGCDEPSFGDIYVEIEYPGSGRGTHTVDVDVDGLDLERELRDVRDAAWNAGDVIWIADTRDEIHDQFDAFIAENEAESND